MQTNNLVISLKAALAQMARPSSDYDLNPNAILPPDRTLRAAGVLVAIIQTPTGPSVILTKRSSALKHHPGQIAFPGGKMDDTDKDVTATALREAQEEIGLDPSQVEIIGLLPAHETVTGFNITPVVGLVAGQFDPLPEKGEVEEVFFVPLDHLLTPERYSIQSRRWRGQKRKFYTVPWGPYYIWGATARILRGLADQGKAR